MILDLGMSLSKKNLDYVQFPCLDNCYEGDGLSNTIRSYFGRSRRPLNSLMIPAIIMSRTDPEPPVSNGAN